MHLHDDGLVPEPTQRVQNRSEATAVDVARAIADPAVADPAAMLELQRLAGNRSVSRLVEDERDATVARSPVLDIVGQGGGAPLARDLRREMEHRLGADFGDVRIHTGGRASDSARSVQANAYTVGREIVFRDDRWSPDTESGKRTLAHELAHVVQQRSGPVAGTDTGDGIRVSDPDDEFERAADHAASSAMQAPGPAAMPGVAAGQAAGAAQRDAESSAADEEPDDAVLREADEDEDEEESLQGEFVQREGEEDEDEEESLQGEFVQREGEEDDEEAEAGAAG